MWVEGEFWHKGRYIQAQHGERGGIICVLHTQYSSFYLIYICGLINFVGELQIYRSVTDACILFVGASATVYFGPSISWYIDKL